jgi:GntR family transcriptional regulator
MQPEPTPGVVPVHHQIADSLRARILSGELAPGDDVPSVGELARQWRCSPGSARSALAVLSSEGRITGGRGKRATVRRPHRRISLSIEKTQHMKDMALKPESERRKTGGIELTAGISISDTLPTYRYETITTDEDLSEEFKVAVGTKVLRRTYEIVDKETGVRLAWSRSYIPLALVEPNPALLDESNEPWPGGHQHQLYTVGIEVDRIVKSVTAIQPTPGERQKWGMEPGVPLLHVRSRSVDPSGQVVELSDATYPSDRTDLVFVEQLARWPEEDRPKKVRLVSS